MKALAEEERVAFYGALIWMAHADGHLSRSEIEAVYNLLDLEELTVSARRRIGDYLLKRPSFVDCLQRLADAQLPLRHAILANLIDIAMVDGEVDPGESVALYDAARLLSVTSDQLDMLKRLLADVYMVRRRGEDDDTAIMVMQEVKKALKGAQIPVDALALCGAILGLRHQGFDRALKALGVESFPEYGISAIILLGSATAVSLNGLFVDDTIEELFPGPTREARREAELERKEDALGCVFSKMESLPRGDTRWEGLHEASAVLSEHVQVLRQKMAPGEKP
jgi:uncharacterized tellurite resistance protein B-like protein